MVSPSEHQYQTAENIPNQYLILGEIFFGKTQKRGMGSRIGNRKNCTIVL